MGSSLRLPGASSTAVAMLWSASLHTYPPKLSLCRLLPLAADLVTHTVVIHNTGNAKLRGVSLSTVLTDPQSASVTGLSAYSCLLDNAGSGLTLPQDLAAGHALHCTASYAFSSAAQIEAGDLTFTPTVSATSTPTSVQQAAPLVVAVPSLPHIDVHLADATCAAPALSNPTLGAAGSLPAVRGACSCTAQLEASRSRSWHGLLTVLAL